MHFDHHPGPRPQGSHRVRVLRCLREKAEPMSSGYRWRQRADRFNGPDNGAARLFTLSLCRRAKPVSRPYALQCSFKPEPSWRRRGRSDLSGVGGGACPTVPNVLSAATGATIRVAGARHRRALADSPASTRRFPRPFLNLAIPFSGARPGPPSVQASLRLGAVYQATRAAMRIPQSTAA